MQTIQVLIDSDALVARFYPKDPHHQRVLELFSQLEEEEQTLVTTSLVVVEVATVLSHRSGQDIVRAFLDRIDEAELSIIHIDVAFQQQALQIFREQAARGTSVTDCANVAMMRRFAIPQIFSFDKVYPKHFELQAIT
ncbi:MAG: hypothetical protein COU69_01425 [Candidatus Pacebacteria bacterium CG10_big_fil_rev_8_21_14_0_10_56_10]|nr:MAG: hypothetical protein COU69_01425 [Candidatus Pacebacteria bacterium CG10_big_fil_rev_8_21_14_0_10_56_10]